MPDTPSSPDARDDGSFIFEVTPEGNLLIDGGFVESVASPIQPEEPVQAADANEVPDDEDTPKQEEPQKKEEPKVEAEPKKEPEPPPAQVVPEKLKLKLTVNGEEKEREFTPEELRKLAEKGIVANKRFEDAWKKEREIEPFLHIKKSPLFKEWLNEMVQSGQIDAPKPPPPPEPEDVMGYRLRSEEPEFTEIHEAMKEWAATLPVYEAAALNDNHRVFNMAYDRFKAARGAKKETTPPATEPVKIATPEKEVVKAVLATKEKIKESARSESPGVQPAETDAVRARQKREADLRKRMRNGDRNAEVELAQLLYADELMT